MNTQAKPDQNTPESEGQSDGSLTSTFSAVSNLVSSAIVPTSIQKNIFKAFNQLCTAAIDVPASYLEGFAAEERAKTQARVKIISTNAEQITDQMNVNPELLELR